MGAALSFLFASSTLINAKCENISCASGAQCCTSVAAVQSPVVRRTGGFLKKRMTTIYVDSRKRVAGSDSDFEVDLGESLHLQSDARLAVYKIRLADSFLSTDRGRYLDWVDAALGTLNWALLPEGAYTGTRLAAWVSSNFATATYSETTNSLSVAYDGNWLILNDLELRQQFPNAADYPAAPPASPTKPFSVDHMLGPSFVSGGQRKPVLQVDLMKEIASQARFSSFFSPLFGGVFPGQATRVAVLEEALRGEARCRSSFPPPPALPLRPARRTPSRSVERSSPSRLIRRSLKSIGFAFVPGLRGAAFEVWPWPRTPSPSFSPFFFRSIPRRSVSPGRPSPSTSASTWKKRSGPRPFFLGGVFPVPSGHLGVPSGHLGVPSGHSAERARAERAL